MEIDIKNLEKSCISVEFYILLQLLSEEINPTNFNWLTPLDELLLELEEYGYIKIIKPSDDDERIIELRQKGIDLFKSATGNNQIDEVILYLNEKAGKRFNPKTEANRKFVKGRLAEKYTVDDLKAVVDIMVSEWKDTKFEDYLRPETLFNSQKFQTYINKVGRKKETIINTMI